MPWWTTWPATWASPGRLIAGFSLHKDGLSLETYDDLAAAAGLDLIDRGPPGTVGRSRPGADYAVSVHGKA